MLAIDTMLLFTHNPGKAVEFEHLLQGTTESRINFVSARSFAPDLVEPEETGTTFQENALIKAVSGATQTGLPTLADDSGLCVDALGGAPGVRSSRFAQDHKFAPKQAQNPDGSIDKTIANNLLLLRNLESTPAAQRQARFRTNLALALPAQFRSATETNNPNDIVLLEEHPLLRDGWFAIIAEGCVEGEITMQPAGNNGFGYDPIFFSHDLQKTFGDANSFEKSSISHRAKALQALRRFLCAVNLL